MTFTAPASGSSATFSGSSSATALTNASGVAMAPTLTANGQAGGYTVTASVAGVATPASFSLTNTAAPSDSGEHCGKRRNAAKHYGWHAVRYSVASAGQRQQREPLRRRDSDLHCPREVERARRSQARPPRPRSPDSSGIASAPALTANSLTGSYTVTATVTGVSTPANFALTNTTARRGFSERESRRAGDSHQPGK